MTLRVLMLNNEYPPFGGGTATINHGLLEAVAGRSDVSIDLVTVGTESATIRTADNVVVHYLPLPPVNIHHASNMELLRFALNGLIYAGRLHTTRRFDVCFAWCSLPAGAMALALRWARGLPYVVRTSGPDIPDFEERYTRSLRLLGPVLTQVWRFARTIVVKSERERQLMAPYSGSLKIETITNAITVRGMDSRRSKRDHELRILNVGRHIERKGQEDIIRALAALRGGSCTYTADFVGTGDSEDTHRELARTLGVSDLVRFHGYVAREQLEAHLDAADVFVLPTRNEGMSVATLEAMASGLPIVSTFGTGMDELVGNDNGALYPAGDINALTRILERFGSCSPPELRALGAASLARARVYSWEHTSEAYVSLLKSVVSKTS